jgi:hypothetical protein
MSNGNRPPTAAREQAACVTGTSNPRACQPQARRRPATALLAAAWPRGGARPQDPLGTRPRRRTHHKQQQDRRRSRCIAGPQNSHKPWHVRALPMREDASPCAMTNGSPTW